MGRFNDALRDAGILPAGDGLKPQRAALQFLGIVSATVLMRSAQDPIRPGWPVRLMALLVVFAAVGCSTPPAPTQARAISVSASDCKQPPYPAEARRDGAEGTTQLDFEVDAAGKVTRVAIVKSAGAKPGHRALDALALESLKQCVFPAAPGFLPSRAMLAYVWRLHD